METLLQILLIVVALAAIGAVVVLTSPAAWSDLEDHAMPADEHEAFPGDVGAAEPSSALRCISRFGPVCCDRTRCQMTGICTAKEDSQA